MFVSESPSQEATTVPSTSRNPSFTSEPTTSSKPPAGIVIGSTTQSSGSEATTEMLSSTVGSTLVSKPYTEISSTSMGTTLISESPTKVTSTTLGENWSSTGLPVVTSPSGPEPTTTLSGPGSTARETTFTMPETSPTRIGKAFISITIKI